MKMLANKVKNYPGENPFGDYQGRNFPDKKVCSQFYPISTFWSLFNPQHEIILGSRGSGKTFLLKMMRHSMLKRVDDANARELINKKEYIALYVPMHIEFVSKYTRPDLVPQGQVKLFQVAFNCLLAQSLLVELRSITDDILDEDSRIKSIFFLVNGINDIWFGGSELRSYDFKELSHKIDSIYYNLDVETINTQAIPTVFKHQICSSLLAVKPIIEDILDYVEPIWIICVDEAEFLNETLQRCINNVFRSDSNRIALKVASLPFYHTTLETLIDGISVSEGNDFNYRIVDMDVNGRDFVNLTNQICYQRLCSFIPELPRENSLEHFLGVVGNGDLIDYYRNEVGEQNATQEVIEQKIIDLFSDKKASWSENQNDRRKAVYDKYAPLLFLREMYKRSQHGNSKPGWFAGPRTVRKVTQGNPRLFIHLMNNLFEKAKKSELTTKAQHEVVMSFSNDICNSTLALESLGPVINDSLHSVASILQRKVHDGELIAASSSFTLSFVDDDQFRKHRRWIELAIAHSRLIVDDSVKKNGYFPDTKLTLAGVYSVKYWLPMRKDTPTTIEADNLNSPNTYVVRTKGKRKKQEHTDEMQESFFKEMI